MKEISGVSLLSAHTQFVVKRMGFTIGFESDPVLPLLSFCNLAQVANTESSFCHLQTGDGNIYVIVLLSVLNVLTPSVHNEHPVNVDFLLSSFLSMSKLSKEYFKL